MTTIAQMTSETLTYITQVTSQLDKSDLIALAGAGIGLAGAISSALNARAARRAYEEAEAQRLAQSRPHLEVEPATQGLFVSLAPDRVRVADPDGLPFGLVVRNAGRGRSDRIDLFYELRPIGGGGRNTGGARRFEVARTGAGALEAATTPQHLTLSWRQDQRPALQTVLPTRTSCQAQIKGLDVDDDLMVVVDPDLLLGWVAQALAEPAGVELRCLLTTASGDGEVVRQDMCFRLDPHLEAAQGDGFDVRFRVLAAPPPVRLGREARAAQARNRKAAVAYVADTRRRVLEFDRRAASIRRQAT